MDRLEVKLECGSQNSTRLAKSERGLTFSRIEVAKCTTPAVDGGTCLKYASSIASNVED